MTPRPALADLPAKFDLIIIGGGITGAGILREATRTGARVLLVEQGDFASGTSSGSSKLVHGGLRYLKTGKWRLTLESVRERRRLLAEAPGLVEPQTFVMPIYRDSRPGRFVMGLGLRLYDRMAGTRTSRWLPASPALELEPHIGRDGLLGALSYEDARTDDARLVLRLLLESMDDGGIALNYVKAERLLVTGGAVHGVALNDAISGQTREIESRMVINATGAWAARLPGAAGNAPPLRPLRGSHFVFPLSRLPIRHAVSWLHPRDRRPIFAYPWEGIALCGTTDLDHDPATPLRMSRQESDYLLEGLDWQFPGLKLTQTDAISTFAGVRPVVSSGKANPSAESRESALWSNPGVVHLAGGKLTTFRVQARQALAEAARQVEQLTPADEQPVFAAVPRSKLPARLSGRLGTAAARFVHDMPAPEMSAIGQTPYLWSELRWAARHERVVHLDDLLLRRIRFGLVAPEGGRALLPQIRSICQAELGWDDARWDAEHERYFALWRELHSPR